MIIDNYIIGIVSQSNRYIREIWLFFLIVYASFGGDDQSGYLLPTGEISISILELSKKLDIPAKPTRNSIAAMDGELISTRNIGNKKAFELIGCTHDVQRANDDPCETLIMTENKKSFPQKRARCGKLRANDDPCETLIMTENKKSFPQKRARCGKLLRPPSSPSPAIPLSFKDIYNSFLDSRLVLEVEFSLPKPPAESSTFNPSFLGGNLDGFLTYAFEIFIGFFNRSSLNASNLADRFRRWYDDRAWQKGRKNGLKMTNSDVIKKISYWVENEKEGSAPAAPPARSPLMVCQNQHVEVESSDFESRVDHIRDVSQTISALESCIEDGLDGDAVANCREAISNLRKTLNALSGMTNAQYNKKYGKN